MKAFARSMVLLGLTMIVACQSRTPIYRANVKLLVTKSGLGTPAGGSTREDDNRFIATQADILRSVTILRRTQQRMKKTVEEVRDNLTGLNVAPVRGADIIIVSVESPSPDFAKEFANELTEEYLRFRDEQRVQTAEAGMLQLTHEVKRLGEELKAANERLLTYAKEHNLSPDAETPELQNMRDDRERDRSLYNALLGQLMKIDATQSFSARNVSILEPAILQQDRVR